MRSVIFCFMIVILPTSVVADEPFNNGDVISLTQAGLGVAVVVAKVEEAIECSFDLSTAGILALKEAGVADSVIEAMLKKGRADRPQPSLSTQDSPEQETGRLARMTSRVTGLVSRDKNNEGSQSAKPNLRPCEANTTKEGIGFIKTVRFRSHIAIADIEPADVFVRALRAFSAHGWEVKNSNKEAGTVSASEAVPLGAGQTVTFNLLITPEAGGSKLDATMMIPAGVVATTGEVRVRFCKVFDFVEGIETEP